jgi:hypothetical protein
MTENAVERIARMIARGLGHNDDDGMHWERYAAPARIIVCEALPEICAVAGDGSPETIRFGDHFFDRSETTLALTGLLAEARAKR